MGGGTPSCERKTKILIYGNGGEGKKVASLITALLQRDLLTYTEIIFLNDFLQQPGFLDLPVISFEQAVSSSVGADFVLAVGEPNDRARLYRKMLTSGFCPANPILDPNIPDMGGIKIGCGTVVHYGAHIQPDATIGNDCMVNMGATIGHDVIIADHSVVSVGAIVSGGVSVGERTYIGSGAVIRDHICIGQNCIVGMGAIVTKDVEDDTVVVGNPARVLRKNSSGRVFS